MRKSRRDKFISAAQVAYHYGYSLADAIALSSSERYLLLSVAYSEDNKKWLRLGQILGTNWKVSDLIKQGQNSEDNDSNDLFLPLLPFVAPDLFTSITKDAKEKAAKRKSLPRGTVEIGTLSKDQAEALFKSFSAQSKG